MPALPVIYISAHDDAFIAYVGVKLPDAINAVPVAPIDAIQFRIRAL